MRGLAVRAACVGAVLAVVSLVLSGPASAAPKLYLTYFGTELRPGMAFNAELLRGTYWEVDALGSTGGVNQAGCNSNGYGDPGSPVMGGPLLTNDGTKDTVNITEAVGPLARDECEGSWSFGDHPVVSLYNKTGTALGVLSLSAKETVSHSLPAAFKGNSGTFVSLQFADAHCDYKVATLKGYYHIDNGKPLMLEFPFDKVKLEKGGTPGCLKTLYVHYAFERTDTFEEELEFVQIEGTIH